MKQSSYLKEFPIKYPPTEHSLKLYSTFYQEFSARCAFPNPLCQCISWEYGNILVFTRATWRFRVNSGRGLYIDKVTSAHKWWIYSTFSWSTRSIRYLPRGFMSFRIKAMMISIPLDSWVAIHVYKTKCL